MIVARSEEVWMVAFFLSRYGSKTGGKKVDPPKELKTNNWNNAYRMFYDSLNQGRTMSSFENSLKNARDSFDSNISNSGRTGWRDKNGNPIKLEKIAQKILDKYCDIDRQTIWEKIKIYVNDNSSISGKIVNDSISLQETESEYFTTTKTEGGKKVVVSNTYERNPKLRSLALKIHGCTCMICGFNFEQFYGEWGKEFAEVHHMVPLSEYSEQHETDPEKDLIVLCANCHRMIHRKEGMILTPEELRQKIKQIITYEQ